MKHTFIATTILALATTIHASNAVGQQAKIKPGLWQVDISMPGKGESNPLGDSIQRMQEGSMSLDERKDMAKAEADLAAKGTVITADGIRTKECFTKERIARLEILGEQSKSCTQKTSPSADGVTVSMQCTDPEMQIDVRLKYQGDKAYTFDSVTTMPVPGGEPITLAGKGSGKWLSNKCGKFKPASVSK